MWISLFSIKYYICRELNFWAAIICTTEKKKEEKTHNGIVCTSLDWEYETESHSMQIGQKGIRKIVFFDGKPKSNLSPIWNEFLCFVTKTEWKYIFSIWFC